MALLSAEFRDLEISFNRVFLLLTRYDYRNCNFGIGLTSRNDRRLIAQEDSWSSTEKQRPFNGIACAFLEQVLSILQNYGSFRVLDFAVNLTYILVTVSS